MIATSTARRPRSRGPGNRAAGHSRCGRLTGIMVAMLLVACSLAGCRPTSEMSGQRYKHNGLGFAVTVPAGWSHLELGGDLVVRLEGPPAASGLRPVAHVFCRDEWTAVDLEATAAELSRLLRLEASVPGAGPLLAPAETAAAEQRQVSSEPATVGELPARRIVRSVTTRTSPLREETLIVARGKRVWALVLSLSELADGPTRAAADELRKSFEVW